MGDDAAVKALALVTAAVMDVSVDEAVAAMPTIDSVDELNAVTGCLAGMVVVLADWLASERGETVEDVLAFIGLSLARTDL